MLCNFLPNDKVLWLNEKHVEEGLDHKNLPIITKKCPSNYSKHRYKLMDKAKKATTRRNYFLKN